MAFLPTKILRFTMSGTAVAANFSGTDDGWLGYPYRWTTTLNIVPQAHGSRETPTPYFYTGNDVVVGDYIATSGCGRILKIISISSQSSTSVTCAVEDENRQNILADQTTSGTGGIPDGEGILFSVKNGLPILHPIPDALAGNLPPHFSADIAARFFNEFSNTLGNYALRAGDSFTGQVTFSTRVGIGIATPTVPLHVVGNAIVTGTMTVGGQTVVVTNDARLSDTRTPTDNTVTTAKLVNSAVTYAKIQNVSVTDRLLGRSSAGAGVVEEIVCTAFGRSLLDDTDATTARTTLAAAAAASPVFTGQVTVAAGTATAPAVITTGDTNTGAYFPAADTFALATGGVERLRVDSTGNVGIGTAPPSGRRLTIQGSSTGDGAIVLKSSSTATGGSAGFLLQCFGANSEAYVWQFEAQPLIFGTANTERMRIDSFGRVSIGSTGSTNNLRLFSSGGITTTPGINTGSGSTLIPRTHISAATYSGQAALHGILALKFPFASGTGVRFRIRGLDMQSTATAELWSFDYGIYASTSFMGSSRSFHYSGLTPFSQVRVLVSGGEYFLALGDIDTLWQYPHLVADVDFFYSGANVDANSLQWVSITDESTYSLYSVNHNITIDNVYPATGNIGIGLRVPTAPLTISKEVSTHIQTIRPAAAGAVKVSGNDQELLHTLGTTGASSSGAVLVHRSYEPAADYDFATWASTALGAPNGSCANGSAVGISGDGNRIVISSPTCTIGTTLVRSGTVRIFQYNSLYSGWYQVGSNINGEASNDQFGTSVAISGDGRIVAAGAPFNAGGGASAGHVRVYEYTTGLTGSLAWTQLGADIDGINGEQSGISISLNTAGDVLAIGSPNYSTTLTNVGRVRVFYLDPAALNWVQRGGDIIGTAGNIYSGTTVCLNGDGTRLAVFDFGGASNVGQVKVYAWNGTTWNPLGQTLTGITSNSEFGRGLAFNSAGTRLAVGAPKDATLGVNQGATYVYDWDSTAALWTLNSPVIFGEVAADQSGTAVSLNYAGDRLAIGAPFNAGSGAAGSNRGGVRVYTNPDNTVWQQLGADLNGDANDDRYGTAVAISGDGSRVIAGAPFYDLGVAVTFQNAANTVTRTSHGFANGDPISFNNIGTATGIATNTIYYVINAATSTFQLAATSSSTTPIDITADSTTGTALTLNSGRAYILTLSLGTQVTRNQIRMADGSVSIENGSSVAAVTINTADTRVQFNNVFGLYASNHLRDPSNTINIPPRMAGRIANTNPQFIDGTTSGYAVYGGSGVALSIVDEATLLTKIPNATAKAMKVAYSGSGTTVGHGGFATSQTRATSNGAITGHSQYREKQRQIIRLYASIPVGRTLQWASNAYGTGGSAAWITPQTGTGDWQEYALVQQIGAGGSLGGTNYFYINGGDNVAFDWYVAICELIDVDAPADIRNSSALSIGYDTNYNGVKAGYGGLGMIGSAYVGGSVGIGLSTGATAKLDISGDTLRLRTARTPASATAAGNVGDICWDANFVYVCVATNTWRRAALSAW